MFGICCLFHIFVGIRFNYIDKSVTVSKYHKSVDAQERN